MLTASKKEYLNSIGIDRFIWSGNDKLTEKDIVGFVSAFFGSQEFRRLEMYADYYEAENTLLLSHVKDRAWRNKTPNYKIPTAYYSTVVDSMAGYMFQNVDYISEDEAYINILKSILDYNESDIKDMISGLRALAFNKSAELVYTEGDENNIQIKFSNIDPREMIFIYDTKIEPEIFCAIWVRGAYSKDYDYMIDVIYADEWQYYNMVNDKLTQREEPKELLFSKCPVVEYRTEVLNDNSSFHVVIAYINALDAIVTGNTNEIDKLMDAVLVIGQLLTPELKENMSEWKVIEGMSKEDRAEYLTKNLDPAFREYCTKLLIQEIHKHSHVIDWYSPDSGLTGEVSAKALQTRLFDMDMFSKRIEKIYRKGANRRIDLINELLALKSINVSEYDIIFNRTLPNTIVDTAAALNGITFISNETKLELAGIDVEKEKERLKAEYEEETITIPEPGINREPAKDEME